MNNFKKTIDYNYHTHNKLCGHASGDAEQYIQEAIKNNFKILGLSDHCYLPNPNFNRCSLKSINEYIDEVEKLKSKYQNQIKVLNGLEVDYFPEYQDLYDYYSSKLDYMILSIHYLYSDVSNAYEGSTYGLREEKDLDRYKDLVIQGIKSKMFSFIAHPDIFLYTIDNITKKHVEIIEEICKVCQEYDFPVEYNANGLRLITVRNLSRNLVYPNKVFFEYVKKYNLKVLINSDCHNPFYLNDQAMKDAYKEAEELGLNIIDKIELIKK